MMKLIIRTTLLLFFNIFLHTSLTAQSTGEKVFKANYRSTQISQYSMTENDYKPGANGLSTADVIKNTNLYYSLYLNLKDRTSFYLHDSTVVTPTPGRRATTNIIVDFTLKSADQKTHKKERTFDQIFYSEGSVGDIEWNITNEVKEISGMKCYKAKAKDRDMMLTAYFTKEIPLSSGPSIFQGLPGLVVWVEDYFNTIELTNVEYLDVDDTNYHKTYDELLTKFNDKANKKYKVEESVVLLTKVEAALDIYSYKHGKAY